jgi:hypothetical protein
MAGHVDVNGAERLSQNPTFLLIGSEKIWESGAAPTSRLQSFEIDLLTQEENVAGLAAINRELIATTEAVDSPQQVVLDMDSTEIPVYGRQEQSPTTATANRLAPAKGPANCRMPWNREGETGSRSNCSIRFICAASAAKRLFIARQCINATLWPDIWPVAQWQRDPHGSTLRYTAQFPRFGRAGRRSRGGAPSAEHRVHRPRRPRVR